MAPHDVQATAGQLPVPADARAQPRLVSALTAIVSHEKVAVSAMLAVFLLLHGLWFIDTPDDLDSFNLALGVRDFDVADHRPHPPGAPVYIVAGRLATSFWRAMGLPVDPLSGVESAALSGLSLLCGVLSLLALWRLVRQIDGVSSRALHVTLIAASAPLLWLVAARPVSDVAGLSAVLAVYLLVALGRGGAAAICAGLAVGVRVQTGLWTLPVFFTSVARAQSRRNLAQTGALFAMGVALWLVPLLVTSGPWTYWTALTEQARHDWSNPLMLAAAPAARHALEALGNALVRPWGNAALSGVMLAAALAGAIRLQHTARQRAADLAICAVPYLLFHLFFQETATIRYALPLTMAVAYLAAIGLEGLPRVWRHASLILLVGASLSVSAQALQGFADEGAPAMRMLSAMHRRAVAEPPAFVTGHANINMRRVQEILPQSPPWQAVWPKAPYEWRALVDHWANGSRRPVWFVADPRRTDLALIDRRARHVLGTYAVNIQASWIFKGLRPRGLTWIEQHPPAWIGIKGFALTPEINGLSERDGEGPGANGAMALVRRTTGGGVLAIGGRYVGAPTDRQLSLAIDVDGRRVATIAVNAAQRHYHALVHLRPNQLAGQGAYATVIIRSARRWPSEGGARIDVEHFDYQPHDGVLFAYGAGWHEPEMRRRSGPAWRWMARRSTVLVHRPPHTPVTVRLAGDVPSWRLGQSRMRVLSGGRVLDEFASAPRFSREATLAADAAEDCDVEIAFESGRWFVPSDVGESADRRELAVRLLDLEVAPARRK